MDEIFLHLVRYLYREIFLYPIGLFRVWFRQRDKSLKPFIPDNSFDYVANEGRMLVRDIMAAGGVIILTALVILMIFVAVWSVFKAVTS